MDSKRIVFNKNFDVIYLLSRPVEVGMRAGLLWTKGVEEMRTLAIENQGVVFKSVINGVEIQMLYPEAKEEK